MRPIELVKIILCLRNHAIKAFKIFILSVKLMYHNIIRKFMLYNIISMCVILNNLDNILYQKNLKN